MAVDIASRSGHRVAAIEALRTDGFLEFVAIAGNPSARTELLGRASPLALERLTVPGVELAGWLHVPHERLDEHARDWLFEYGHTPDRPPAEGQDGWHPHDQLVRLLANEDGELRAILYLDEPLSDRRPTAACVEAINDEVHVMYEAIVSIVERELYGEQVRMVAQARTAMQSVRPGLGVDDSLREMSEAMVEAMAVDTVDVLLVGRQVDELEPHTADLADHMRHVWLRRGHLVVEPTETWGHADDAVPTPEVLRTAMDRRGLGSWLLVPVGMGDDYLGTMGLGRRHGGPRWIDSEINAAAAVASDVAGVVFDARLMERERTLNQELRDTADYRHDMVMTLAHELRNPVSVLWTHLELLAQDPTCGRCGDSLGAMDRAARRIEDMIEDLMALATVSDPERTTSHEPVDLSVLVGESAHFLSPVAARSDLELTTHIAADLVIAGDPEGLRRMATNLLSNAIKYTPAGGRVVLSLDRESVDGRDGVRLDCVDDGIGIAAAEIDQIFTPFFRSSSRDARQRPGTGLGLAITDRVVRGHGGTMAVRSELGVGTSFTVWLPLAGDQDAGAP